MSKFVNKFSERLREALRDNSVSQSELARRVNVSLDVINNYCTGRRAPSFDTLIKIAIELGESIDYLVGLEEFI